MRSLDVISAGCMASTYQVKPEARPARGRGQIRDQVRLEDLDIDRASPSPLQEWGKYPKRKT